MAALMQGMASAGPVVRMRCRLRWTLIKPPRLTHHPMARPVHAAPDLKLGLQSHIGPASLAQIMLDAVKRG